VPYYSNTRQSGESQLVKQEFRPAFCRESYILKAGSGAGGIRCSRNDRLPTGDLTRANVTIAAAAVAGGTGNGNL